MNSQGARGREMLNKREAGRVVFTIFYYGLIISLALAALRYSTGYWDSFFRGTSVLAPTFKASIYIAQGLCASAVLLLLRFRKAFQRNQARFILGVLSAAVLFLFLEMTSRPYVCQSADESIQSRAVVFGQCGLQSRFAPHHYLVYYGTPGYRSPEGLDSHNSWGFRGPEIAVPKLEGVHRIAILWGSAAYTFGVNDWRKDFPR